MLYRREAEYAYRACRHHRAAHTSRFRGDHEKEKIVRIAVTLKIPREKAFYTYPVLFGMVFVYHAFSFSCLKFLMPLFLLSVPLLFSEKIRLKFTAKDILTGILVSAAVLLPFCFFASRAGKGFVFLPAGTVLFQLAGVAFPEEVYFRGFLQERLGNTPGAVVVVSVLFAFAHLPQLIFYSDLTSVLTFFPSLVMGFLYMRTANVVTSTIFHFSANIVFLSLL